MLTRNSVIAMRRSGGYSRVEINGQVLATGRSLKVENHSPTGFEWGYGGSGPSQLALAIMLEAGLSDTEARSLYMQYKRDVVASLDYEDALTGAQVLDWIVANKRQAAAT